MSATLQDIIARGYAAKVLGQGQISDVVAKAKIDLAVSAGLKAEAQSELTRLNAFRDIETQCFISARARDFLRVVLE